MKEKELRRLRRQDLLQLLLLQNRETAKLQDKIAELTEQNAQLMEDRTRLHAWLDEKEAQLAARSGEKLVLETNGQGGGERRVTLEALLRAVETALSGVLSEQEDESGEDAPPEDEGGEDAPPEEEEVSNLLNI